MDGRGGGGECYWPGFRYCVHHFYCCFCFCYFCYFWYPSYCHYYYYSCWNCFSCCGDGAARAPFNPSSGGVGAFASVVAIAAAVAVTVTPNTPCRGIRAVGAANSIPAKAHGNGGGTALNLFDFRYLRYFLFLPEVFTRRRYVMRFFIIGELVFLPLFSFRSFFILSYLFSFLFGIPVLGFWPSLGGGGVYGTWIRGFVRFSVCPFGRSLFLFLVNCAVLVLVLVPQNNDSTTTRHCVREWNLQVITD